MSEFVLLSKHACLKFFTSDAALYQNLLSLKGGGGRISLYLFKKYLDPFVRKLLNFIAGLSMRFSTTYSVENQ